ncbi:PH domain-containing protein [Corynebacterium doosanense]|uniref:Membrane protein n=1 Tax=Corynebacterium doosanense CAU 212 = DSM 45436 TaxID=558173 RepID=A0A097IG87_9CORY|nr:PH domain-containing protein [Corynebacterium doosanense]AIT61146.1 membrane protein [Corynebacterium doosanense CAU 212 = DSM 45436]
MADIDDSTSTPATPRQLSDEDRAKFNALDPHAVVSTKPWEFETRSSFLRRLAIGWVILVLAIHIWVGLTVDIEYTGAAITGLDKWAFPGVGLIISLLSWWALNRPRLRANADGVEVQNIVGTRFYPWYVVYGLSFPQGSRMARIELPEFEYVPVWAMQSADGASTVKAVSEFRELEAQYMPED